MPGYAFERLCGVIGRKNPERAQTIRKERRKGNYGLLSVGLKLHFLGDKRNILPFINALGGEHICEEHLFRKENTSLCLVLPPVGSSATAILLLEAIGEAIGTDVFGNRDVQIQVCTPGRLNDERAALLGAAFYLGSDTLRRYVFDEVETTFSKEHGRRLLLYDASGEFDRDFDWWSTGGYGRRVRIGSLPFIGRTDVLAGVASRTDIENINLVASLLTHAEKTLFRGYWHDLGRQFERKMRTILSSHHLSGVVKAPWVASNDADVADDGMFVLAINELIAYAFDEAGRIKKQGLSFLAARSESNIMQEVHSLLLQYREEVRRRSPRSILK